MVSVKEDPWLAKWLENPDARVRLNIIVMVMQIIAILSILIGFMVFVLWIAGFIIP